MDPVLLVIATIISGTSYNANVTSDRVMELYP